MKCYVGGGPARKNPFCLLAAQKCCPVCVQRQAYFEVRSLHFLSFINNNGGAGENLTITRDRLRTRHGQRTDSEPRLDAETHHNRGHGRRQVVSDEEGHGQYFLRGAPSHHRCGVWLIRCQGRQSHGQGLNLGHCRAGVLQISYSDFLPWRLVRLPNLRRDSPRDIRQYLRLAEGH